MYRQSLPSSAEAYAVAQREEMNRAMRAVGRQWRRMGPEFDQSYYRIEPTLLAVVRQAQTALVAGASQYIPAVLDEQGLAADPLMRVSTSPLIGVAGDGRPVDSLLHGAVTGAKTAVGNGSPTFAALRASGQWLTTTVGTVLSDTARQSEALHAGVRPVTGYVRMLNGSSCSRCVVLAGRFYRKNMGFLRHPKCDCRHIPSTEALAGDMTVDPVAYFDSLSKAEQDATFGAAGGEAIRSGADVGQVVNARRGVSYAGQTSTATREMWVRKPDGSVVWESRVVNVTRRTAQTTQIGGRSVLATTEGTTRRGVAGRLYARAARPRLMPETISTIATDRADYLRLLASNGYMG